jgi:hypothetical protein
VLRKKIQRLVVRSIDEAIDSMRAIDQALPHDDGVAHFNRLY